MTRGQDDIWAGHEGPIPQAFEDGVRDTLHDVATRLRRGDFLPGGELYKDQ